MGNTSKSPSAQDSYRRVIDLVLRKNCGHGRKQVMAGPIIRYRLEKGAQNEAPLEEFSGTITELLPRNQAGKAPQDHVILRDRAWLGTNHLRL